MSFKNTDTTPVEIVLFTRPNCKYCTMAKELLLTKSNIGLFQIVLDNQESYQDVRDEMVRLSGGVNTVPQIFIAGKFQPGGYSALKEMQDSGELDKLLALTDSSSLSCNKYIRERVLNENEIQFDMDI